MDLSLDFYTEQVDPAASDNFAAGFYLFNEWYNETNEKLWKCTGDGVWIDLSSTGGLTPEQEQIIKGSITGFNSTGVTINDNNSPLQIPMTNLTGENSLGYNIASGSLTIPVSGWYLVSSTVNGQGDNTRNNHRLEIVRNGVAIQGMAGSGYSRNNRNSNYSASISPRFATFPFAQGDSISIQLVYDGDNNADMTTNPQESWITLEFKGN
jgi:hypothetical protein